MRDILSEKIIQLEQSKDFECWYLVKQSVDFTSLCYKVCFLDSYKKTDKLRNIESYINDSIDSLNKSNPSLNIEKNYRQLRIAAFFGLIEMKSSKYEEARITDVFYEIQELCNGKFENINLYQHIIDRQIEKLYVSSIIDEGKQDVRKDFSIYPVIFLYKLLLEIGYSTGKYLITFDEYRYIVTTTKKYEDFAETLILIKLLRDNPEYNSKLIKFRMKFDNRINQALGLLSTLKINHGLKVLVEDALVPFASALNSCTANPAKCLGVANRKGYIKTGYDADLVVLEDNYDVCQTYCKGKQML